MNTPAPPSRSMMDLRELTPARVALGRAGASLPTTALLEFTLDHARARDAVHAAFDTQALIAALRDFGLEAFDVRSRAGSRGDYLRRPDLGRRLDQASLQALAGKNGGVGQLALVIGDGLSPTAVHAHAIDLVRSLVPQLAADQIKIADVAVASGARVALGDEIGAVLGARMVVMLIGERPGLSAPDSLGAYLTFAPRVGVTDAERNCVSNIRPDGLPIENAARLIASLVRLALTRKLTGLALKQDEALALMAPPRSDQ